MIVSALCYIKDGKLSDVFFHDTNDRCEDINMMYVSVEDSFQFDYILSMSRPMLTTSERSYMVSQMFNKFKELVKTGNVPYQVTGKDELVVAV